MPAALKPRRLLSLEAGGERISAALFEDRVCVGSAFEEARQRQTEKLAPLVHGLLEERDWSAASLGAIAVGRGPGSFTGLRSSMAFGEGLGLATGARMVGMDTLTAWAQAAGLPAVAVALDGRRGQVYFGRYEKSAGTWKALEEPALLPAGDAWARLGDLPLVSTVAAPVPSLPWPQGAALAVAVGELAWARWQGRSGLPLDWEPQYLRRAEAQILWEKLHPKVA